MATTRMGPKTGIVNSAAASCRAAMNAMLICITLVFPDATPPAGFTINASSVRASRGRVDGGLYLGSGRKPALLV